MKAKLEKHLLEIERKLCANDTIFYKNNLVEDCQVGARRVPDHGAGQQCLC
jgi:hypothetical protein